jgi:CRISPR/Cas system-associated endonuclease Cas1
VERYQDEAFRLSVAKAIVAAKITHQQRLLRRRARNHPNPLLVQVAN